MQSKDIFVDYAKLYFSMFHTKSILSDQVVLNHTNISLFTYDMAHI